MTPEEIEKLASLARIELTAEEKRTFGSEIEGILSYVSEIQSLPTGREKPLLHLPAQAGSMLRNILRDDTNPHESGAYTAALLAQAPAREGDHIRVKRIL